MKTCIKCNINKDLDNFSKNKSTKDGVSSWCKCCYSTYSKNYFQNVTKDYRKIRKQFDYLFKIKCNIHSRTSNIFRKKKFKNNNSIHKLLGCDYDTIINHLQDRFQKGMTFENYGKWHIDHIIPLSSAKTKEELIKLSHYTNLQPLWALENISKGAKIL